MMKPQRALISVHDKTGIADFAKGMSGFGIEILWTGGTLKAGWVGFDLDQWGGVLAPGRSVGRTVIDGSYAQFAGALAIELGGNDNSDPNHPQYDVLEVVGAVYLAGTLELNWLPVAGDANSKFGGAYDVLIYGGVLIGEFASGNISGLPRYQLADEAFELARAESFEAVRVSFSPRSEAPATRRVRASSTR